MVRYLAIITMLVVLLGVTDSAMAAEIPGTAYSRPNVSGGFDFYDSEGNKVGFSSRDHNGNYVYYDSRGSIVGSIKYDPKSGKYKLYDGDNIRTGELSSDPYGGYRYKKIKEDAETSQQLGIRKDYKYANPYGDGIETLPLSVITGGKTGSSSATGLETESSPEGLHSTSIETKAGKNTGLSTTSGKGFSLSTKN